MSYLRSLRPEAGLLQIFQAFPEIARPLLEYHEVLLRGDSPFSAAERELIAAYVSGLNNCTYCHAVHSQAAVALGTSADVLSKMQDGDVDLRMRPVLAFVRKLTLSPGKITPADAETFLAAGWNDRALYDAAAICGLFNLMNRLVNGLGIEAPEAYMKLAAQRLAAGGWRLCAASRFCFQAVCADSFGIIARQNTSYHLISMKVWSQSFRLVAAAVLLVGGAACLVAYGDFTRYAAAQFQIAAVVMATGWMLALTLREISGRTFWVLAVALRLILLPMQPGTDLHRYIWEGRIQTRGFDPYEHAPNAEALRSLRDTNWYQVEFKETTAIYPPLAELGFRLLAFVSQTALSFKLAFVAVDLVICFLLSKRFGFARSLLYAWNPLVLYSFAGGAHFDSWFILCLVVGWLLWERQMALQAVSLFGVATALKWVSLPILVWSLWRIARTSGARKTRAFCHSRWHGSPSRGAISKPHFGLTTSCGTRAASS